jgi:hypothetical protein
MSPPAVSLSTRRRWLKHLGVGACVLLLAAGALSFAVTLQCPGPHLTLALRTGILYYWTQTGAESGGIELSARWGYHDWWFDFLWVTLRPAYGWIPLWVPFLLVFLPTATVCLRDWRRQPPGHCQACGYDLTGNVSGRCPECGRPL